MVCAPVEKVREKSGNEKFSIKASYISGKKKYIHYIREIIRERTENQNRLSLFQNPFAVFARAHSPNHPNFAW